MTATWIFIECCWVAWLAYWLIMAFATKRTIERRGFIGYRVVALTGSQLERGGHVQAGS